MMKRLCGRALFVLASLAGFSVSNVVSAADAPTVQNVLSRKSHGAVGPFSLTLASSASNPSTEPRTGPAHTIVFVFNKAVTAGTASVSEGTATAGTPTFSGSEMIVPLTGVTNQQYVTVNVTNVTAADGGTGGSGSIRLGFLAGDVSQNRAVSLSDLLQVNAQLTQVVASANYLLDVNASGTLSLSDMLVTNGALTNVLPDPAGPGPWNGTCPGFANTRVITMNWANPVRMYTTSVGTMSINDVLVVKFTTGNVSTTTSLPRIVAAEYQTSPSTRIGVLSAIPCDFSVQSAPGSNLEGNAITAIFAIGTGSGSGYYPVLNTNTTYYLNIKNAPNASCAASLACDMFVDLIKPTGL